MDDLIKPTIEMLDHTMLNKVLGNNASAERLAEYLLKSIDRKKLFEIINSRSLEAIDPKIYITVYETEKSYVVVGDTE